MNKREAMEKGLKSAAELIGEKMDDETVGKYQALEFKYEYEEGRIEVVIRVDAKTKSWQDGRLI